VIEKRKKNPEDVDSNNSRNLRTNIMKEYYGRYDGLTLQISPWECYCKHKENYYNGKG
jgi:hypothetical protein|tara:strand:+ start:437 stop:610 length:174 start_codon:yes stop_codon:yes gene_type:complete